MASGRRSVVVPPVDVRLRGAPHIVLDQAGAGQLWIGGRAETDCEGRDRMLRFDLISVPGRAPGQAPVPARSPLQRFRLPLLALALVVGYAIAGYMLLEHWSLIDAVYMTITTVTTIGYQEVRPLDEAGRIFNMTVIISGVGTMLYTFGIFGELLVEGQIASYAKRRRMERRVPRPSTHSIRSAAWPRRGPGAA